MAAPVRAYQDRNTTHGQLRGSGGSQQNSGNAHAERTLEMRPLKQSIGMSLDATKEQIPLMGPNTFHL